MWFRGGFFVLGLMLLGWAAIVVAIAALTTWWVLFALLPLGICAPVVAFSGGDPRAGPWVWCAAWFAPSDREAIQRGTSTEGSTQ